MERELNDITRNLMTYKWETHHQHCHHCHLSWCHDERSRYDQSRNLMTYKWERYIISITIIVIILIVVICHDVIQMTSHTRWHTSERHIINIIIIVIILSVVICLVIMTYKWDTHHQHHHHLNRCHLSGNNCHDERFGYDQSAREMGLSSTSSYRVIFFTGTPTRTHYSIPSHSTPNFNTKKKTAKQPIVAFLSKERVHIEKCEQIWYQYQMGGGGVSVT